jgi:lysophospholipase L1-like esterase
MTPNQTAYVYGFPVRINSLGLRGSEPVRPKALDQRRLLFVGDSVTYGGGRIREEQLFARIVESQARQKGKNWEVVNLSAPGWSPQNWWKYIQRNGLHDADVVVLVLPECDLARPFATMGPSGHRSKGAALRLGNFWAKAVDVMAARDTVSAEGVLEKSAKANLAAVEQLHERIGSRPLLSVLIPSNLPAFAVFWPSFEAALDNTLDLRESLKNAAFFLDGVHLSVEGHQVVGEQIFEELQKLLQL